MNASLATPLPTLLYEVGKFLYFFEALIFAHLASCAAAILFRPAADILRRARVVFFALLPVFSFLCITRVLGSARAITRRCDQN